MLHFDTIIVISSSQEKVIIKIPETLKQLPARMKNGYSVI